MKDNNALIFSDSDRDTFRLDPNDQLYKVGAVPELSLRINGDIVECAIGSPAPANPLEMVSCRDPILTVTATHNILIGTIDCSPTEDYQFVIAAGKVYKTTMTPEEYQTIKTVIKRAVLEVTND